MRWVVTLNGCVKGTTVSHEVSLRVVARDLERAQELVAEKYEHVSWARYEVGCKKCWAVCFEGRWSEDLCSGCSEMPDDCKCEAKK